MFLKHRCIAWLIIFLTSACAPRVPPLYTVAPTFPRSTATLRPTPTPANTETPRPTPTPVDLSLPVRAAFYQAGYPQAWDQNGQNPATHFHPDLGNYNQDDPALIRQHIAAMQYGKIQAGIIDWWGLDRPGDQRIHLLFDAAKPTGFRWAFDVQSESTGDPEGPAISGELETIRDRYAAEPAYLKLGGRFVVFVSLDANDGCAMAERWVNANNTGAYLVLKAFEGSEQCAFQPDGWQANLAESASSTSVIYGHGASSFIITPGIWKSSEEAPLLERDLRRWMADIRAMTASSADFQLIATFNDWSQGSAVEGAGEWPGGSGFGQYLDALHFDGDMARMYPYQAHLPIVQIDKPKVLVGAGDIGACDNIEGPQQTAALLAGFPDAAIFTAGDNTQGSGSEDEFNNCFDPTWGQYKDRIHPSPGNHDADTDQLGTYFDYYGEAAGERGKGYYSYELGGWHIISLNSDCEAVGGCLEGTAQEQWLREDLAAHPAQCTLAYWHHPFYSSGRHGDQTHLIDFWRDLYAAGVELVINGHDHDFERFARQDPNGNLDPEKGIREMIVGTGGASTHDITWEPTRNSEIIITHAYGLLELELYTTGYGWQFIPVDSNNQTDSGWESCH